VLSHRAAAALWDLCPTPHGAIDVTVPGDAGRKRRPGIRLHRSAALTPAEMTVHLAIPVTTATRTIIDLARTTHGRRLEELIDRADLHGLVNFATLRQARSASLKAVLQNYRPAPTRSELEEAFLRLCDNHDIPRPETNTRVEGYTVDFVWRDVKLAVEVDGYRYHRAPHKFETDRERDVVLTAAGWTVLRFTWRQLTERPAWVAAKVRACARERRPASRTPAGRSRRRTGTAA
jgi:very-short-patch-repair endonuclease